MKRSSIHRIRLAAVSLVLYLGFVLVVTLSPSPVDRPIRRDIDRVLEKLHDRDLLPAMVGYSEVEFLANVALFIPAGFIAALLVSKRTWWLLLLVGPAVPAVLEFIQGTLLPERVAAVSDIVANSAGALIGALIALCLRLTVAARDRLVIEDALEAASRPRASEARL